MYDIDKITKAFMSRADIFADAVNFCVFGGKEIVHPEDLREGSPSELYCFRTRSGRIRGLERFRDVLKNMVMRECDGVKYVVVGIENQTKVDLSMPARCMLYDSLRNIGNIRRISERNHIQEKEGEGSQEKNPFSLDFLSGLRREDRIPPVVTLVVYWGNGNWDGPRSLHEMVDFPNETVRRMCADFKLNLIEPAVMEEEDFQKLRSELGQVLHYVKVQDDDKELERLLNEDAGFSSLGEEACMVINAVTGSDFPMVKKQEEKNMCKGLDKIKEKAFNAGKAEGKAEGIAEEHVRCVERTVSALKQARHTLEEIKKILMDVYAFSAPEAEAYLH